MINPGFALRKLFYRNAIVRFIVGVGTLLSGRARPLRVMHLLSYRDTNASGPVQRPEALLLNAMVQVVMPKVVVEFGFLAGHSTFNFLQALDAAAKIYSYDISALAAETAETAFQHFPNFRFLHKSQSLFSPADIDHQKIDLLFFDAVHDFELNQETWRLIEPSLADGCLIVVHDTGTWQRADALAAFPASELNAERWLEEREFEHQPGERQFVNWIRDTFPEYCSIHFHSVRTLRHGLTVLQRNRSLPTRGWRAPAG